MIDNIYNVKVILDSLYNAVVKRSLSVYTLKLSVYTLKKYVWWEYYTKF